MAKGWNTFAQINTLVDTDYVVENNIRRPMTLNEKRAKRRSENKVFFRMMDVVAADEAKRVHELVVEAEEKAKLAAKKKKKNKKNNAANKEWKKEKQQRHLDTIKQLKAQSEKR